MVEPKKNDAKRITLLFSGGVDSTMAACQLAEQFDSVELVTYNNGYGHYHTLRTARRAEELAKRYPGVFSHTVTSVQGLFDQLVVNRIDAEYAKYGSGFVWCMGCKIAMHMQTILHCVDRGIYLAADGSSFDTSEMVEQMPESVAMMKGFYCEYGITFDNPVYKLKRRESIRRLKEMGFSMGVPVGDRFLGVQPKCKAGELYYMPYLLLGSEMQHDKDTIVRFIEDKMEWARTYIADYFARRGLDLDKQTA